MLMGLCAFVANNAGAAFTAGIAVRKVTPDPLLPVSGGTGPSHAVTQNKEDLTVRALVLNDGTTRVAIVSVDFLGFPSVHGDKVRAKVPRIPADHILIGATHTHSAPDMYCFPDENGNTSGNPKYIDFVIDQTAAAINEAIDSEQPASVKINTGEARGKIAYNAYAEELYDPRCNVMQFLDTNGKPFATLVNYAIHPEVLGNKQGILSPDLIGPLYDEIAAKGGGTGIFMNSAQGGMVTADNRDEDGNDHRTWPECLRIGHLLADQAMRIIADAPVQQNPSLYCVSKRVDFPIDTPLIKHILTNSIIHYPLNPDGSVTVTINLVNFGNAQILTIPGEALPDIGYYLKRKMNGKFNCLFGLTNDAFGYILTKEDFDSFKMYDYISETSLGERTGPILEKACLDLVKNNPAPK